jgi:hypothetical protein
MMRVVVDLEIARMDVDNRAANAPSFRIPAHLITDFETIRHEHST